MAIDLLVVVALILVLGVGARILADHFAIPSVLFLIAAGILAGPEVLGIVTRDSFGEGLRPMVGVAVSIILFEGAFRLQIDRVEDVRWDILRLVTLGALLMWVGTAAVVKFVLRPGGSPLAWEIALLIGALLIATGPTVIRPILNVVTLRDHVAAAMESEGIINDVTAAVIASVILQIVVLDDGGPLDVAASVVFRLGVGAAVGVTVGAIMWWLLARIDLPPLDARLHARLIVLGGIIGGFAIAESISPESGIAAAATLGFTMGNVDLPHVDSIVGFTEDLTTVVLAFVFVALATLIDFSSITALGFGGVVVVVAVTLAIRPALVFLSIRGQRFTRPERLFMSLVGPRGIIPASVAILFAIELEEIGAVTEADALLGTVFLIIFATVVFQGGLARHIATYTDVIPMKTLIIGGGRVGSTLAKRLERDGENVVVIDQDPTVARDVRDRGHRVIAGDGSDTDVLEKAGAADAGIVVAATADDEVNLLVSQLAQTTFGVDLVAARVNDSSNLQAFEAIGVNTVDSAGATASLLEDVIERPTLTRWVTELDATGDAREISVTAGDLAGRTIADIHAEIPDGCIVGLIRHADDTVHAPRGDHTLSEGDAVTFIGQKDAVERAVRRFHPHE